ncbi:MAG: hypothetical protein OQK79_05040 [Rhodanobacter sp.]|nr:hypothetical protein [Rhodanobacter sp.]
MPAIAMAHGLGKVAPCFVDADTAPFGADASGPKGGLTAIVFPNHLVYLITWYFLALMVAIVGFYVARGEMRQRRR